MNDQSQTKPLAPTPTVERLNEFAAGDLAALCDATLAAIESGGGFGWIKKPERSLLERYWQGVLAMPSRILFVARMDHMICGSCQLLKPPINNEAQKFSVQLTTSFIAPWARGHGLAKTMLAEVERVALEESFTVINLDVRETMESAINLYESAGYTRFGTHPHYAEVDGKVLKGYYYTKTLK